MSEQDQKANGDAAAKHAGVRRRKSRGDGRGPDQTDGDAKFGESQAHRGPSATAVSTFDFQGRAVRTVTKGGQVWFVAADVCGVLDVGNASDAVARLDDDEKGVGSIDTPGGAQALSVISESGLYHLILTSRKEEAKAFRRWVTSEVLPEIRITGRYEKTSTNGKEIPRQTAPGYAVVELRAYGRYVVMNTPHGLYVDSAGWAVPHDVDAIDFRILSHTMQVIEGYWRRFKQVNTTGRDCRDGYSHEGLETAIKEGSRQAERALEDYERRRRETQPG